MECAGLEISVVIPAHNREQTLGYCVDSVIAQTYQPIEILVVDDCSSDRTAEIAISYADPRVKVLRLPCKSGAQAARNAGIRAARGEWIAFLDSDDEWLPEKLARQVEVLLSTGANPLTVVHTDCWRLDKNRDSKTVWHIPVVEGRDVFRRMLASGGPMFQGMLTSKQALAHIGFLDEEVPSYQEWDTALRLARICHFIHIKEPLFIYHCHDGETISGNFVRSVAGYRYIVEKFRDEIIQHLGIDALDAHLRFCALKAMQGGAFADAETVLDLSYGNSGKTDLLRWVCRLGRRGGESLACRLASMMYRRLRE